MTTECPHCLEGRIATDFLKDGEPRTKKCPVCDGDGEHPVVAERVPPEMPVPEAEPVEEPAPAIQPEEAPDPAEYEPDPLPPIPEEATDG